MVAGSADTECSSSQGLRAGQADGAHIASGHQEGGAAILDAPWGMQGPAPCPESGPRWSLLQTAALVRCLCAVAVSALLWLAVA
ncbi:hypothetical protein D3C71_1634780 [compost metagenome]